MAINAYSDQARSPVRSATRGALVTTGDDNNDLTYTSRMLIVSGAGNIKITTRDGDVITVAFPAGAFPIEINRIWATSLTATGVSVWW